MSIWRPSTQFQSQAVLSSDVVTRHLRSGLNAVLGGLVPIAGGWWLALRFQMPWFGILITAVVLPGSWLAARRMECMFDDAGVTMNGPIRTVSIGWDQIIEIRDGEVSGGEAGPQWVVQLDLRAPRRDWLNRSRDTMKVRSTTATKVAVLVPFLHGIARSHGVESSRLTGTTGRHQ